MNPYYFMLLLPKNKYTNCNVLRQLHLNSLNFNESRSCQFKWDSTEFKNNVCIKTRPQTKIQLDFYMPLQSFKLDLTCVRDSKSRHCALFRDESMDVEKLKLGFIL